jgi:hypothetical protein
MTQLGGESGSSFGLFKVDADSTALNRLGARPGEVSACRNSPAARLRASPLMARSLVDSLFARLVVTLFVCWLEITGERPIGGSCS